jgi:hypothetical protein
MAAGFHAGGLRRRRALRPAVVVAGPPAECPACRHPVSDHPGGDANLDACAACLWEADLGIIEVARLCTLPFPRRSVAAGRDAEVPALPVRPVRQRSMDEFSDDLIVEEVVSRLTSAHSDLDPAELTRQVRDSLETTFRGARVRRFLPVLIERRLSARLRMARAA